MSSSQIPMAAQLTTANMTITNVAGMDVIFTPEMQALAIHGPEHEKKLREVVIENHGMTREMIPNRVVDAYIKDTPFTDGVIGYASNGQAVLLDRLTATFPKIKLDIPEFTSRFTMLTGGLEMISIQRINVVPPLNRLVEFTMPSQRLELIMQDHYPASGVTWYEALGLFDWLGSQDRNYRWGYPDALEHQVAGLAGRNPKDFPYPTKSGTLDALSTEACFGRNLVHSAHEPSGTYPENPWGYRDMAGNLWQWMGNIIHPESRYRVLRGGAFFSPPYELRADYQGSDAPTLRSDCIGLRGRVSHYPANTSAMSTSQPEHIPNIKSPSPDSNGKP